MFVSVGSVQNRTGSAFTSNVSFPTLFSWLLLLKWVLFVAPLERVDDAVVDPHRDGTAHDGQGDCGDHGDDAQLEQGQQAHHQPCEHHARSLCVLPVDQVHHWKTGEEERGRDAELTEYSQKVSCKN